MQENFINANPVTIIARLYQLKAEQDGIDGIVTAYAVSHEEKTDEPAKEGAA